MNTFGETRSGVNAFYENFLAEKYFEEVDSKQRNIVMENCVQLSHTRMIEYSVVANMPEDMPGTGRNDE